MQRLALLTSALILSGFLFAQSNEVINAYMYLQEGKLAEAKTAIDKASVHEKTKAKAKTWLYSGEVYLAIFTNPDKAVKTLDLQAAQKAYEGFKKSLEMDDVSRIDRSQPKRRIGLLGNYTFQEGVNLYNEKDYQRSYDHFLLTQEISTYQGKVDSLAMFNCGLTAENMDNFILAREWYDKCIEIGYQGETSASSIVSMLTAQRDYEAAFQAAQKYRKVYPEDYDLLISEVNLLLMYEQYDKAEENIRKAIQMNPSHYVLHYSLGTLLDRKGDATCIDHYEKALQYNPNYFDAHYNAGAHFYNRGADKINELNDAADEASYNKLRQEALSLLDQALPYLEKAHQLNPTDQSTLISLRDLYMRKNDSVNFKRIDELLNK